MESEYRNIISNGIPACAISYLDSRRLSIASILRFGVGYADSSWWFPFHDKSNKLVGLKYRNGKTKGTWAQNHRVRSPGWFGVPCIDYSLPYIIITEGEWDAIAIDCVGIKNSISLPYGAMSSIGQDMIDVISGFKKVIVAVDNDEYGNRKARDLIGLTNGTRAIFGSNKDANDALIAGFTHYDFMQSMNLGEYI